MQFGAAATLKSICCKANVVSGLRQAYAEKGAVLGTSYALGCTGTGIYRNVVVDCAKFIMVSGTVVACRLSPLQQLHMVCWLDCGWCGCSACERVLKDCQPRWCATEHIGDCGDVIL